MEDAMLITSLANPLVKEAAALLAKKGRKEQSAFLLEGIKSIFAALESGYTPLRVFWNPDTLSMDLAAAITAAARERGFPLLAVTDAVLGKITEAKSPQPLVAVFSKPPEDLESLTLADGSFVFVLDGVADPGNAGAIIRIADALGGSAVFFSEKSADLFSPKTLRASMGSFFHLPVRQTESRALLAWLRRRRFYIVAAAAHGGSAPGSLNLAGSTALILGSEAGGIGSFFAETADATMTLSLRGRAESLNVATAAALFLYEARGRTTAED
jgi:TrmH family RNA methyltransferase